MREKKLITSFNFSDVKIKLFQKCGPAPRCFQSLSLFRTINQTNILCQSLLQNDMRAIDIQMFSLFWYYHSVVKEEINPLQATNDFFTACANQFATETSWTFENHWVDLMASTKVKIVIYTCNHIIVVQNNVLQSSQTSSMRFSQQKMILLQVDFILSKMKKWTALIFLKNLTNIRKCWNPPTHPS